jgi:glycosyltransferase involved in cell wall biosynthesis
LLEAPAGDQACGRMKAFRLILHMFAPDRRQAISQKLASKVEKDSVRRMTELADKHRPKFSPGRAVVTGRSLEQQPGSDSLVGAAEPRGAMDRYCFLVAPSEQRGGGMGRVADYLVQTARADVGMPRYIGIDPRGSGHVLWSPFHVLVAMARLALGAILRNVALVHFNVAERGSLWRKGVLILWARALRLPIVLHLHAAQIIEYYRGLPRLCRSLVRSIFASAVCCIVLGDLWRRFVIDELGVDASKVVILYNGVPRARVSRKVHPSSSEFRILFLGNLMERKGVTDLLEALACKPICELSWHATFAGGGPVEFYSRKADSLGLQSRVLFPGWVDQRHAAELLAASDVLVLPSYDEGLPLVILEALTAGVPVVCTPVGAIPEVLEDGKSALFVPPGDRQALADVLTRLVREPALRERLTAEGRALYEREFSVEVFAGRVAGIYREFCGYSIGRSAL